MNKIITMIILSFSLSQLFAEDILTEEITGLEEEIILLDKEINELEQTVDGYANVVVLNSNNNILETLKKYNNTTVTLIEEWIKIASQIEDNDSLNSFIILSKYQIKAYLERLLFTDKNTISIEDYNITKDYINNVNPTEEKLNEPINQQYSTKKSLYLRSIPIISKMTLKEGKKKPIIVPKNYTFKLLYSITYNSVKNEKNHWGYIIVNNNGYKGWINLKNTFRLKK